MKKTITLLTLALLTYTSTQAATPQRTDTIPPNGVELRGAYIDATSTIKTWNPSGAAPGSIEINRDPVTITYSPTDLVRKVMLKAHTPADEQRIQNVRHVGWNWNQSLQQWVPTPHNPLIDPAGSPPNGFVWGNAQNPGITYDPAERSLLYFDRGSANPAKFDLNKGLLLSTGPGLMAEGPNESHHSLNEGFKNDGTKGIHHNGHHYFGGNPGWHYRFKHQPGGPWNPSESFDRDLDNLTQGQIIWTTNGSVLEFDFQPAIGRATFDYIFASDEYPEGIYSANDVFGFFVSGPYDSPPGHDIENTSAAPSLAPITSIPEHTRQNELYYRYNIARLPDNNPVGIDYVNWGIIEAYQQQLLLPGFLEYYADGATDYSFPRPNTDYREVLPNPVLIAGGAPASPLPGHVYAVPTNPHLFRYNYQGEPTMEYDGYTTILKAVADSLVPGKWYHLKLAVSNTVQEDPPGSSNFNIDQNHGSGVFLANLDLGEAEGSINEPYLIDTVFDIKGRTASGAPFIYDLCDAYVMTLTFDTTVVTDNIAGNTEIKVKYINIDSEAVQRPDGEKLFSYDEVLGYDTIQLTSLADSIRTYQFRLSTDYTDFENGQEVGVVLEIATISSTLMDTILYSPLYKHVEYGKPIYYKPTAQYPGKLEIPYTLGSPQLHRSLNGGITWELATYPFTKSQIANIGDEAFILYREPNTCFPIDTVWVSKFEGPHPILRPIDIPRVEGMTTDLEPGIHYIYSQEDFVFIIYPGAGNEGKVPVITTGRVNKPDSEGVIITKNEDGSFTVRIRQVQEPIKLTIDFVTNNAYLNNKAIWTTGDKLYITANQTGTAQIHTTAGVLIKTIALTAGETTVTTLPTGFYVVTLENEDSHKIMIK